VVVTEGLTDALAVYGAGFDVVAVAGAKVANRAIPAMAPHLSGREVVVAGDVDWAGGHFVSRASGFSPETDRKSPHWWPRVLPSGASRSPGGTQVRGFTPLPEVA